MAQGQRRRAPAKKPLGRIMLIGLLCGALISVLCILVLALLLSLSTFPDSILSIGIWVATALGALVCGFLTTLMIGRKGFFGGVLSGILLFLILLIAGMIIAKRFGIGQGPLIPFLCCLIGSAVGAFCAVMLLPAPKARRQQS